MNITIRILSILGIFIFGFCLLGLIGAEEDMVSAHMLFNEIGENGLLVSEYNIAENIQNTQDTLYAIVFLLFIASLFGLILSIFGCCVKTKRKDVNIELLKLNDLKEKGIIDKDEFEAKKRELLM